MKKTILGCVMAALMVTLLQAEVTISLKSYQKALKNNKITWVKAKKVIPGTVVKYVNHINNKGTNTAKNLVVVNDIPKYMTYVRGSAKCKKRCDITFSIDGGKHFAKPKLLKVRDKKTGKIRKAKLKEYTTVRWELESLKPGQKTTVEYKARLR